MLKRRIIPLLLLENGRLVKTVKFTDSRDVGDPVKSSKVYSDQDADEIILLDISRNKVDISALIDAVSRISRSSFVPLSVGGGIRSINDAAQLFSAGADKVVLNSITYNHPELITQIGARYGRQAIVVGIDVLANESLYELYSDCGRKREDVSLAQHIKNVINSGAGEIMVQSINRDGIMSGYDTRVIRSVIDICSTPVIAVGGAGNFMHLKEVFDLGVDAVGCGSLFCFGDNNPLRAKAFLKNHNIQLKNI